MRLVGLIAYGILIVASIVLVSIVIKILAFMFGAGFNPIVVDFTPVAMVAVVVFAAVIVAFIIFVIGGYIPSLIEEEER